MNDRYGLLSRLAATLDEAAVTATAVEQFAEPIDTVEAYEIQRLAIGRREDRGEAIVGIKMGLTSKAKMAQVGVTEMSWGRLTDGMMVEDGGSLEIDDFIHPRAEPEIAFRLRAPLSGRVTALEAWNAVEGVAPAIEVLDSRFKNFKFRFTDVVADNASSSGFVIGPWSPPSVDVSNLGMCLYFDGRPQAIGSSAAILGHPVRSLVAAADLVARYGSELKAGDIVLSGAATAAEPMRARQHVSLKVEGIGGCDFAVA